MTFVKKKRYMRWSKLLVRLVPVRREVSLVVGLHSTCNGGRNILANRARHYLIGSANRAGRYIFFGMESVLAIRAEHYIY